MKTQASRMLGKTFAARNSKHHHSIPVSLWKAILVLVDSTQGNDDFKEFE
jgi:hypothetical protein